MPKRKQQIWFKKIRGSYLPVAWQGWLSYVPFVGVLLVAVIIADRQSSTPTEAVGTFFVYSVCVVVVMHWIASQKS